MLTSLCVLLPVLLTPGSLLPPVLAQLEGGEAAPSSPAEQAEPAAEGALAEPSTVSDAPAPSAQPEVSTAAGSEPSVQPELALGPQLEQRARMRDVHRALGIATWIAMAGTVALGAIQLRDEYGPFAGSEAETPCARSDAILGSCFGDFPVAHGISAFVSAALYYTTFAISFLMPDPLDSASSPGWAGERLRIHKTLRWLHFATMIATSVFGVVTANIPQGEIGFGERQALAATHFALGATSFALVSVAAAVILF